MSYDIEKIISKLRLNLPEGRFKHSLNVAETARDLAIHFSCDSKKAYLAGLLHDCATGLSYDRILELALETGLKSKDDISINPLADYHAGLGAVIAGREYGINDDEILNAIEAHQEGSVPLKKLDMIIGLADAIEPSRSGEEIEKIRLTAQTDLLKAYLQKHVYYMTNILKNGRPLSRRRVDVYNYLIQLSSI